LKILLVGAGRMGQRHLVGMSSVVEHCCIVDPRAMNAPDLAKTIKSSGMEGRFNVVRSFDEIDPGTTFDAAILSATANGRLNRLKKVIELGVSNVLVEKPLEQSREAYESIVELVKSSCVDVRCNLVRRTLEFYEDIRKEGGPFVITVNAGANGLACNGIHWIDFAVNFSRAREGRLLYGEVDTTPIESGRGKEFRDYGGRGLFAFDDGSRLFISSSATSSAPESAIITQPHHQCIIDKLGDAGIMYSRMPESDKPPYLYGQDYQRNLVVQNETIDFPSITKTWIGSILSGGPCVLPTLDDSALAYRLLYDLLETSGQTKFAVT